MFVYVVTAYQFGNKDNHSYVVGVFDSFEKALISSEGEEEDRGGKYSCEILEVKVNHFPYWTDAFVCRKSPVRRTGVNTLKEIKE